jgi:hypothetical protein
MTGLVEVVPSLAAGASTVDFKDVAEGAVAFRGRVQAASAPESPEALYRDLPRKPDAVPGLWVHQGDILRAYADAHVDAPDLALELPTGTGKTLPGLLIGEWVRRVRTARVAYACPTQQLARQVAATAEREGIPTVVLVGPAKGWPLPSEGKYDAAGALAIVTYSTIFNSSPKLSQADLLIFDDAHAGEQYAAGAYAVTVRRQEDDTTYHALLDAVAPALGGMALQRLRDQSPDPSVHSEVRLVVPLRQAGMVEAIDAALGALTSDQMYRYSMIRAGLASCLVYVSYGAILVRPLIPPTSENPLYAAARQRLYLSATLGESGELERSFGRAPIARLSLPPTAPAPRSGRRFFVFPGLVPDALTSGLTEAAVARAGKALVLAPDTDTAVSTARELAAPGWPVLTIDDVANGMEPFAALEHGTCGLAARYDGLDLPGDGCRAVVLDGKPDRDNLQERFLSTRVRAGSALAERIRTRVVQGAGRCTRGPNDWAVVVVCGPALTKYLLAPDTLAALDPELQAEIQFGIDNSTDSTSADVLANIEVFLEHGDDWRDGAEPLLADYRRSAVRQLPAGTDALAQSVTTEIAACAFAAAGRWSDAARLAQDAARELGAGGDATRGYRAMWLYLAGVWADQAGADGGDGAARRTARSLIAQAEDAARPATWPRELAPLPDADPITHSPAELAGIAAVAAAVEAGVSTGTHDRRVAEMLAGLDETDSAKYEPALTTLGTLLGAEAWKPSEAGRCDSVWCWQNHLWIAVEAKSDHDPAGLVPHRDVRQANDQLRLLCADRNVDAPPPDSATVIMSPRTAVDPTGARAAEPHVHLVGPAEMLALAADAAAAWAQILAGRAGRSGDSLRALVAEAFAEHSVLAPQVLERLTEQRIAGA